ncbi:MAG: c-type cytochrome [Candidatus Eisenbacteria bacterium]|uniref:C-type cytochrome n=1 Tax=Eiseniibacteriota bacterium TaxID=2212470 RepID=A0A7Y2EB17_UNCEI|nr:c-type cytochrome [Candidatus Eisenbacteria bacterium]
MSKPEENKVDQVFEHDFDGIQEFDNRLPNWWLYTLYGAVIFGVLYWMYFHTTAVGPLPEERYEMTVIQHNEEQLARMGDQELTDETLMMMAAVPARVAEGKALFQQFCTVCHLEQGQGSVGPNLTDKYWIHGPEPLTIHGTVMNGVPEKGMAAWGGQLGPKRVNDVVAFVLTLKGTEVAGKDPEGELYETEGP